jgi:hypothetical protein
MPLINFTPLPCLPFDTFNPTGTELGVVLVKVTLDLVPADTTLQAQGFTHGLKLSQTQSPLAMTDTYHGEFLNSSLYWESDTADPKPKCDVIFIGDAHAPGSKPLARFQVRLKLSAPDRERPTPHQPFALEFGFELTPEEDRRWQERIAHAQANPIPGEFLLDKRLQVTGERWLIRRNPLVRALWWLVKVGTLSLIRRCPLRLTRPKPLTTLPLRYEYAFGGHVKVHAADPAAQRVPRRVCLPGVDRGKLRQAWKKTHTDALLAEAFWPENPVGRGYSPFWQFKASRTKRLPAPQIEAADQPFTAKAAWKAMLGKANEKIRGSLRAQGMGVITRNWEPRVGLAGTWNDAWVASGTPYPPDYSLAFNNYAHPDLQCRHLAGDETVELTNLCPPAMVGARMDAHGNRVIRFKLPGLFPFLLLTHETGERVQVPAVLDTLILEPGLGRVILLQRASFLAEPQPEKLELRLAMPGEPREVKFELEADETEAYIEPIPDERL